MLMAAGAFRHFNDLIPDFEAFEECCINLHFSPVQVKTGFLCENPG